jgi:hypothetical protein
MHVFGQIGPLLRAVAALWAYYGAASYLYAVGYALGYLRGPAATAVQVRPASLELLCDGWVDVQQG